MKYFIAIALIAAVASAGFTKPTVLDMSAPEMAEVQEIIAAINSPSTDPATAVALEQLLQQVLGIAEPAQPAPPADSYEPISVGPAIVDSLVPISIDPAIIDFPLPESALAPTPVAPAPTPDSSSPLVQIIVNVNQAQGGSAVGSPVAVEGIPTPQEPVTGVEGAIFPNPAPIIPGPVIVPNPPIFPTPVNVAEQPKPVEPVNVAPIIVAPAVVGPEILN